MSEYRYFKIPDVLVDQDGLTPYEIQPEQLPSVFAPVEELAEFIYISSGGLNGKDSEDLAKAILDRFGVDRLWKDVPPWATTIAVQWSSLPDYTDHLHDIMRIHRPAPTPEQLRDKLRGMVDTMDDETVKRLLEEVGGRKC